MGFIAKYNTTFYRNVSSRSYRDTSNSGFSIHGENDDIRQTSENCFTNSDFNRDSIDFEEMIGKSFQTERELELCKTAILKDFKEFKGTSLNADYEIDNEENINQDSEKDEYAEQLQSILEEIETQKKESAKSAMTEEDDIFSDKENNCLGEESSNLNLKNE